MVAQHRRRQVGNLPVPISRVGDIVSLGHFRFVGSLFAFPRSVCENRIVGVSPFEKDFVDRPRTAVLSLAHVVKQLANVLAEVAVILEMLRQRDERVAVGRRLAKRFPQVVHADGVRSQSGQKRRPRRIANRLLTVSPIKHQPPSRQPIQIRSHRHAMVRLSGTVRPDGTVEIVRNDEQHVRSGFARASHHGGEQQRCHNRTSQATTVETQD